MASFPLEINWASQTIQGTSKKVSLLINSDFQNGELANMCRRAKKTPGILLLRFIFQPNSLPFTPQQVHVFENLFARIVPSGGLRIRRALRRFTNKLEADIGNRKDTRELFQLRNRILNETQWTKNDVPFLVQINHALRSNPELGRKHIIEFPRQDLSTKAEIMRISDAAWSRLKNTETIFQEMFAKDVQPQTLAECDVYLQAIENRQLDKKLKVTIQRHLDYRKNQIAILERTVMLKNRPVRFTSEPDWNMLAIRIHALQMDQEMRDRITIESKSAAVELKLIHKNIKSKDVDDDDDACISDKDAEDTDPYSEEEKAIVNDDEPFPIAQPLSQIQIEQISEEAWTFLAAMTEHETSAKILNLMFTKAMIPKTDSECRFYIDAINQKLGAFGSRITIALEKQQDKIQRSVNAKCSQNELGAMEIRIQELNTKDKHAERELQVIRKSMAGCGRTQNATHETKTKWAAFFPISRILTQQEIIRIPREAWDYLVQNTVRERPTLDAIFTKSAMPITATECSLYVFQMQYHLGNIRFLGALHQLQQDILCHETRECVDLAIYTQTHLQAMHDRIKALKMGKDEDSALDEEQMIDNLIRIWRNGEDFQKEREDWRNVFPIETPLTHSQLEHITWEEWKSFAKMTKHQTYAGILDAMFAKNARPITLLECSLYLNRLQLLFQGSSKVSHLEQMFTTRKDKIQSDMDMPCNSHKSKAHFHNMQQRIRDMHVHDFFKKEAASELSWIQKVSEKCQTQENDSNDSDAESSDMEDEVKLHAIFPITNVLSKHEMWQIPEDVLKTLGEHTKNKTLKDALDVMFTKETMPITSSECFFYSALLEYYFGRRSYHLIDALQKLKTNIVHRMKQSCEEEYLHAMQARIQSLNVPKKEVALQEWQLIQDQITKCNSKLVAENSEHSDNNDSENEHSDNDDSENEYSEHEVSDRQNLEPEVSNDELAEESVEEKLESDEEFVPQQVTPGKRAIAKRTNEKPLGSASSSVKSIDMAKALLPAAPLRKLFDAYFRSMRRDLEQNEKRFAVSAEFLNTLNRRLYEWVRDVMHFLNFTSQPESNDRDSNLSCQSHDISALAIEQALELANPELDLSNNSRVLLEFSILTPKVTIPQPRKNVLVKAMLFFAQPLRRLTAAAYRVIATALTVRLCCLVQSIFTLTMDKNAKKIAVCPALTSIGRVPNNKLARRHYQ